MHPLEAQSALLSMIVHGVYERFPRLRVAYMEAGCGWLPSWLHRIDEHLELAGAAEAPELTMIGHRVLQAQLLDLDRVRRPFVADVIRWMGDDHIVFETDFPHPDSKYPTATEHFLGARARARRATTSKRKILWDNAVDLYRFPDGLPARVVSDLPVAPFEAVDYDAIVRAYPPPPEYFETAWLGAARGDRAHAARAAAGARARPRRRCRSSRERWAEAGLRPTRDRHARRPVARARRTPSTTSAGASRTTRRGATTRA